MVLENYGQDYDELDVVDVDGVDEEILEDIEPDLLDDVESEEDEPSESTPEKSRPLEDSSKSKSRSRDRTNKRTKDGDDASSGEEAWLQALESGKLEEVLSLSRN